jgi:hypothetical protein
MLYENKPESSQIGLDHMPLIYEGRIWRNKETTKSLPDLTPLAVDIKEAAIAQYVVIDIERFELRGSAQVVSSEIDKLVEVIQFCRSTSPKTQFGYYGIVPRRDYWRALKGRESSQYSNWSRENDVLSRLTEAVDFLAPSIYTFYPDEIGWRIYANAQVSECRRMAPTKPVFAFLWPKYHDSNKQKKGEYLRPGFWRDQLKFCEANADGLVIWGGYKEKWDPSSPWWLETAEFLKTLGNASKV